MPTHCRQSDTVKNLHTIELTRTALIERIGARRYVYGRYDCIFGAWTSAANELPREWNPTFPLLNSQGRCAIESDISTYHRFRGDAPVLGEAVPVDLHLEGTGYEYTSPDHLIIDQPDREIIEAFKQFCSFIPLEIRRLIAPFGKWQWAILKAISEVDGLERFLRSEVSGYGPNFVNACLILSEPHLLSRDGRRGVVESIMFDNRCVLLTQLSGKHWSRPAIRQLAKFDLSYAADFDLDLFVTAMNDPIRASAIRQIDLINPSMLQQFRRLPNWLCLPSVLRALTVNGNETKIEMRLGYPFRELPRCLRSRMRASLMAVKRLDLDAWLDRWSTKVIADLPFPKPPFEGDNRFKPLTSIAEMKSEAAYMDNCLDEAEILSKVIAGRSYFYRWLGDGRATIKLSRSISRAGNSRWIISEMAGPANSPLQEALRYQILQYVSSLLNFANPSQDLEVTQQSNL